MFPLVSYGEESSLLFLALLGVTPQENHVHVDNEVLLTAFDSAQRDMLWVRKVRRCDIPGRWTKTSLQRAMDGVLSAFFQATIQPSDKCERISRVVLERVAQSDTLLRCVRRRI